MEVLETFLRHYQAIIRTKQQTHFTIITYSYAV